MVRAVIQLTIISIFAVVLVMAILLIPKIVFGVGNPFYVVASGSMIPRLNVGDLVVVKYSSNDAEPSSFGNLRVGDIIVFKTPYPTTEGTHKVIVHRIAQIVTSPEGIRIIRTKGDANVGSIPGLDYPLTEKDYIGKVVYEIPKVGIITQVLSPPVNYVLIGVVTIVLIYTLRKQRQQHR